MQANIQATRLVGVAEVLPQMARRLAEAVGVVHVSCGCYSGKPAHPSSGTGKTALPRCRCRRSHAQQQPEILKAVGVNATVDVFNGMVGNLMGELGSKAVIAQQEIGIERRTCLDMLADFALNDVLAAVWDNDGADFAGTLKDAHDRNLVFAAPSGDALGFLASVRIACLAADEGLVCLNLAAVASEHFNNSGSTYLYVEQQQGVRLTVFEVTDPAHIKMVSSTQLAVTGPFDFVHPLDGRAELIRFRDGKSVGVLDLSEASKPSFRLVPSLVDPGQTEPLGETGYLGVDEPYNYVRVITRDEQVVDISTPSDPILLATVRQVKHRVVNNDTGTTFLLGGDGLAVVRRISVEND